jgi:hypothetical protein
MRPPRQAEKRGKGRPQQVRKQDCGLPDRRSSERKADRNKSKSRFAASQPPTTNQKEIVQTNEKEAAALIT